MTPVPVGATVRETLREVNVLAVPGVTVNVASKGKFLAVVFAPGSVRMIVPFVTDPRVGDPVVPVYEECEKVKVFPFKFKRFPTLVEPGKTSAPELAYNSRFAFRVILAEVDALVEDPIVKTLIRLLDGISAPATDGGFVDAGVK